MPERICVLASGGLDSAILLGTLARRREVHPLVIRRGRDLPLELTLSCTRPRGLRHCGRCTKCTERRRAFVRARIADPTRYASR